MINMRKKISLIISLLIGILTFSSCDIYIDRDEPVSCDVRLTCSYAGMKEDLVTDLVTFDFDKDYFTDDDIIYMFDEMQRVSEMPPNFIDAWIDINVYDLYDNFIRNESYHFWWDDYEKVYLFEEEIVTGSFKNSSK